MSLENVKVGDKLYVHTRYGCHIAIVERVTATLAITKCHRFAKKTGKAQGCDAWSLMWASLVDEANARAAAKNRRRKLISKCKGTEFEGLSDEQLEKIVNIIDSPCGEKGGLNATD